MLFICGKTSLGVGSAEGDTVMRADCLLSGLACPDCPARPECEADFFKDKFRGEQVRSLFCVLHWKHFLLRLALGEQSGDVNYFSRRMQALVVTKALVVDGNLSMEMFTTLKGGKEPLDLPRYLVFCARNLSQT
jgi:hypothetical protein